MEIARVPAAGVIAAGFFVAAMFVPPLLSDALPAPVRVFSAALGLLIVGRVAKLRLTVTPEAVIVVNFFRTVAIAVEDVSVAPTLPTPGYLELEDGRGRTVAVAAAPSWGHRQEIIRSELLYRIRASLDRRQ